MQMHVKRKMEESEIEDEGEEIDTAIWRWKERNLKMEGEEFEDDDLKIDF